MTNDESITIKCLHAPFVRNYTSYWDNGLEYFSTNGTYLKKNHR